ncbi:MAG: ABC transporter ATP-binding protein [Clostridia bacterium]|nr:ABC transporter ATP-binding protein [Clostridia bacterium]
MIEIKEVTQSYVKGKNVIENMSLKVEDGVVFGFLGPNGAGKTTTIDMITGIVKIDQGDIFIDGKSITKYPMAAKSRFGFVPDSPDVFEKLTGLEYLNFIGDVYGVDAKTRLERTSKLAKEFGMYENLKDRIQSYSHGMKQKLLIISVLLHNPKNWILDEPMTGLDPQTSHTLKELMKQHAAQGNTVFFSTHVLEVAEKICDKIAIIDCGKIIFVGTIDELHQKLNSTESLEESFLKMIGGNEE